MIREIPSEGSGLPEPSALFWDVGGVLLSNGWDRQARLRAAKRFDIEWEEFQERHELVVHDFERGRASLEEYLQCAVFHRARAFTRDEFQRFMFAQSEPHPETLTLVEQLAGTGRYLLATLNNESLELNRYRIEQFQLRNYFDLFLSSCFLGAAKPEESMYKIALHVTQREPDACVFIDDRQLNLERAAALGIRTVRFEGVEPLRRELELLGVAIG